MADEHYRRFRAAAARLSPEELRKSGLYKWTAEGDGLGAGMAEMDFGTAPVVAEAVGDAMRGGTVGYLTPAIDAEVRRACARWQSAQFGWEVRADAVRVLPDVVRAYQLAIDRFSRPGAPVIVPTPAYYPFLTVPGMLGREVIEVPMRRGEQTYHYDLAALDQAFRRGADLLVLCNPQNPTGAVTTRDELAAVAETVARHQGRVFADEIHSGIVYGEHRHTPYASVSPAAARHALTATSASKSWNIPGLKCAQVILSNQDDLHRWETLSRIDIRGTSTLGAVAAVAAYDHGQDWLRAAVRYLDGNRRLLGHWLSRWAPDIGFLAPQGTYLAWLDLRDTAAPQRDLRAHFLRHAGVSLQDGVVCGAAGTGFVRFNFATSRKLLRRAVQPTCTALRT